MLNSVIRYYRCFHFSPSPHIPHILPFVSLPHFPQYISSLRLYFTLSLWIPSVSLPLLGAGPISPLNNPKSLWLLAIKVKAKLRIWSEAGFMDEFQNYRFFVSLFRSFLFPHPFICPVLRLWNKSNAIWGSFSVPWWDASAFVSVECTLLNVAVHAA